MTLSIIIVSYNVKHFAEQCLCSVKEAIQNIEAEVIIIDNNSTDDSTAYLQSKFPWVTFLQNKHNEGFAKANNRALAEAKGNYILFLNPDTILPEDALEKCIFFYEQNIQAGAVGVRMLDGSGSFLPESKRAFPSPLVSLYKMLGLSSLFPSSPLFGKYALGYLAQNEVHVVDVISGAFMIVPKFILDNTGGFDERFFMYAEDIDLSYRVQKAGYQNYYLGDVAIVHFKGESTKKNDLRYVKVFYGAMNLFVKKWYRGAGAWLLRQGMQAGIAARGFLSVIVLRFKRKRTSKPFEKVVLWGDEAATDKAKKIIQQYHSNVAIETGNDESMFSSGNNLVVFCAGILSYKKSIELIQQHKAHSYKWFGKNSHSIVGSNNKEDSGEVLVDKRT